MVSTFQILVLSEGRKMCALLMVNKNAAALHIGYERHTRGFVDIEPLVQ